MELLNPRFSHLQLAAVAYAAVFHISGTQTRSLQPIRRVAGFSGGRPSFISHSVEHYPSYPRSVR